MLALFGETGFEQFVFLIDYKVKCGYIIKYYRNLSCQNFSGVFITNFLYQLLVPGMQLVNVPVDLLYWVVQLMILLKIAAGFQFANRIG